MKTKLLFFLTITIIGHISAQSPCNCDYTINSWYWKFDGEDVGNLPNVTIHDSLVAANHPLSNVLHNPTLTLKAGDVVCVDGSVPYRFLRWQNIISDDPSKPIIIKNINGQVVIRSTVEADGIVASYGWMFRNSKNFKILGNGDPDYKYGFKVTTHNNSYIQMIAKTTGFEIAHVEVAGDFADSTVDGAGFVGIMVKSQPICWDDPNGGSTDAGNFEITNVSLHDNYIHGVGGEGMYVGYGRSKGVWLNSTANSYTDANGDRVNVKCSRENFPHNISDLYIYNNIVENVGWDGIQVKNAHFNANIYDNVIKNYANAAIGPHDEGILVGDGSEALIYGNWIENGTAQSNGIQVNAFGNTKIYNNVVLGTGYTGLYLNNNSPDFANRDGTFEIYNNTIEGGTGNAITAYTPQDVNIKNNIAFGFGTADTINDPYPTRAIKVSTVSGIKTIFSNLEDKDVLNIGFINAVLGDVRLATGSLAINAGEANVLNTVDFTGALRTDGNVDIGAIEKGTSINNVDINLSINSPLSNNITVISGEKVSVKASLIDIHNKVRSTKYVLNANVMGTDFMPNKVEYIIPNESFVPGNNTFYIESTLYSGVSFSSAPITISNPDLLNVDESHQIKKQLKTYYDSTNRELVIHKLDDINIENIEVYNLLGEKLLYWKNSKNDNQETRIKVSRLFPAVYIVRIKTDKNIFSKKVIFSQSIR